MKIIWTVLKKELTDQLRDRRTLWLTIIIPLLLVPVLFLWLTKEDSSPNPQVAVSQSLPTSLQKQVEQGLKVKVVPSTHPVEEVKKEKAIAALSFNETTKTLDLYQSSSETPDLEQTLSGMVAQLNLEAGLQHQSKLGISPQELYPWKLNTHDLSKDTFNRSAVFYILGLVLGMAPLTGGMTLAIDAIAGEKERKTIYSLFLLPISPTQLWMGKWLAVTLMGCLSTLITIGATWGANLYTGELIIPSSALTQIAPFTWIIYGILIVATIAFLSSIQLLVSTFARTFKEAQSYFTPVLFLVMIPIFMMMGIKPVELEAYQIYTPIFSLYSMLLKILYGQSDYVHLLIATGITLITGIAVAYLASFFFKQPRWILGRD
ncbi:ABC transporter permease [Hazenella coriacea]|uniref:ABC-type Na+ efflux pump permease subunit n=1 Tax=Hazenella coriacea TaxID=1179467 RepID=A0A4R3L3D3_9BACL|nr:ABC transporter permease subunit [Hazenella coriacea]TCS94201.1 ABC-type Na+ efflux pump permease subunit [Hazenella coriacea]